LSIEQARLLVLKTAWLLDTAGSRSARREIAMIKALAPQMALKIIDRAIQVHGGAGVCQDLPLAQLWTYARSLRIADGPDEVHLETVARSELAE
jgi:acyl-CoA dehydrogenase